MGKFNDRTGEIGKNKHGNIMKIVKYISATDIVAEFIDYGQKVHTEYKWFKKGEVSCNYDKATFGVGYLGIGKYKASENGKSTKVYDIWKGIMERGYYEKYKSNRLSYRDVTVSDEWHNFQNFAHWYYENYYEVDGERMNLDKDILVKGNKVYSPDTCIFVPENINKLFVKGKERGKYPIGVTFNENKKKSYIAKCKVKGKMTHIGSYDTPIEAFNAYKAYKESLIKQIADEYKDKIPEKLFKAMYTYEVEITD